MFIPKICYFGVFKTKKVFNGYLAGCLWHPLAVPLPGCVVEALRLLGYEHFPNTQTREELVAKRPMDVWDVWALCRDVREVFLWVIFWDVYGDCLGVTLGYFG